ncbi:MAG: radical SAM protein [Bacteroidales bacterium]|nr:radical SAM protein [Bacteroidales bacterium]
MRNKYLWKKIRHIPVENIVRDIKESGEKNFMFLDDNIIGHAKYAKELFEAIKPLKINWVGQASVSILVNDDKLLQLAAESGCKALFMGIESVSVDQLQTMHKAIKDISGLETALKKIRKMGILVHASMIFGFDNDNEKIFNDSIRFLIKNKVCTVSFNVLTPYPGTKTFEKLKSENRILTTDWKYYDHNTVVFQPVNMLPYDLQLFKTEARRRFLPITVNNFQVNR